MGTDKCTASCSYVPCACPHLTQACLNLTVQEEAYSAHSRTFVHVTSPAGFMNFCQGVSLGALLAPDVETGWAADDAVPLLTPCG
jgi:hypothetical protein